MACAMPLTRAEDSLAPLSTTALDAASTIAPLLEVVDIHTEFRIGEVAIKAVDGVTFSLGRGARLGIMGESGCGKSVTALTIMRLLTGTNARVTSGQVLFEGRDLLGLSEHELEVVRGNRMAMIFQEPMSSLNPVFSVGDQIIEAVVHHKHVSRAQARSKAIEALNEVGISSPEKRIRQYPHELSGGMQQRVMIAMALSCDPVLLIADEPTTALDVTVQAQILELIQRISESAGLALLLITHDLGVIAQAVDQVLVMYAGRVVESGTVQKILDEPRHPYTQGLVASTPTIAKKGQRLSMIPGVVSTRFGSSRGCSFAPRCPRVFEPCHIRDPKLEDSTPPGVACWIYASTDAVGPA